jgi:short-subunit dehydrogenase involved in D-alanine esterification of teichoic acids
MFELLIITGGCSGFGRVLAERYIHHFQNKTGDCLFMLVTGRDEAALQEARCHFEGLCGPSIEGKTHNELVNWSIIA